MARRYACYVTSLCVTVLSTATPPSGWSAVHRGSEGSLDGGHRRVEWALDQNVDGRCR
jgi:hypothetical protein